MGTWQAQTGFACAPFLFSRSTHMNKMAPTQLIALLKSLPSPLEVASANPDENLSIGFLDPDTGCVIVDPTVSSCGRFKFAPMLAYAVDDAQVQALATINEAVHNAVVGALNAMAFEVQTLLGVTDGGFASAFFSDGELERTMREALAKYRIAELANIGDHEA